MFRRPLPLALLVAAWLAASARAQTSLAWKLEPGEVFYLDENFTGSFQVEVAGTRTRHHQEGRRVSRFTVKKRIAEGFRVEQEILGWDAGEDAATTRKLTAIFKGAKFTFTLAADGAVTEFDGHAAALKRFEAADPAEATLARLILTEEALRAPLQAAFHILPEKAVAPFETWQRELKIPLGSLGMFKIRNEYTYHGPGEAGEKITAAGTLSLAPPPGGDGMPFRVTRLRLSDGAFRGTAVFDARAGRLVRYEMSMPLTASMTVEALGGNQHNGTIVGEERRTVRLLDRNPLQK